MAPEVKYVGIQEPFFIVSKYLKESNMLRIIGTIKEKQLDVFDVSNHASQRNLHNI